MSFPVSLGLEFPAVPVQAVPVIEGRPAAVRAYAAEMARQHLNAADVAVKAEVDPGTVGDFLNGRRWPQRASRGRLEAAVGWPPGSLDAVAEGEPAPQSEPAVAPPRSDEDVIRYQRPPGLSDTEWDRLRHQSHAVVQALLEQAAAERDG